MHDATVADALIRAGVPTAPAPGRVRLSVLVPVAAPPDVALAAITDWPGQGRWMLGTRVQVRSGSGDRIGDRLFATTGLGRLAVPDEMVITAMTDELVVVDHVGKAVRGIGWMGAVPAEGGALFVWGEDADLPLGRLGRGGWPVVRPILHWGLARSLRRLARQVEASVDVDTAVVER